MSLSLGISPSANSFCGQRMRCSGLGVYSPSKQNRTEHPRRFMQSLPSVFRGCSHAGGGFVKASADHWTEGMAGSLRLMHENRCPGLPRRGSTGGRQIPEQTGMLRRSGSYEPCGMRILSRSPGE
ncbi:hypothetical protein R1flu_006994 [Riccia fluitans]|uniref:Uncharacterized protein n=1 Tax=Riccia fluitans TaxID=41844 RepID=A0ABD1YYF8_9MARC